MSDATISVGVNSAPAEEGSRRVVKSLNDIRVAAAKTQGSQKGYNDALLGLQKAAVLINGPLSGVASRLTTFNSVVSTGRANLIAFTSAIGLAAFSIGGLVKRGDEFRRLENRLRQVTTSTKELTEVQNNLFLLSQQGRIGIEASVDTYFRLSRSLKDLGATQGQLLAATDAVNKAVALSGTTSQSAAAAIFQFGQGLASGQLRGQELNSVFEQTPRLALALADGLGVSLAGLRQMSKEGKLTTEVIGKGLIKELPKLQAEFAELKPTLDQAFTVFNNQLTQTAGLFDKALGASSFLSSAIIGLANNFGVLLEFLKGVAIALGVTMVFALVKSTTAFIINTLAARKQQQQAILTAQANLGLAGSYGYVATSAATSTISMRGLASAARGVFNAFLLGLPILLALAEKNGGIEKSLLELQAALFGFGGVLKKILSEVGAFATKFVILFVAPFKRAYSLLKAFGQDVLNFMKNPTKGFGATIGKEWELGSIIASNETLDAFAKLDAEVVAVGKSVDDNLNKKLDPIADRISDINAENEKMKNILPDLAEVTLDLTGSMDVLGATGKAAAEKLQDALKELKDELNSIVEQNETPTETYNRKLEELENLQKRAASVGLQISLAEKQSIFREQERLKSELDKALAGDSELTKVLEDTASSIRDSFKSAFKDIFNDGKLSFKKLGDSIKDIFTNLLSDLAVLALAKPIIVPLVQAVGGAIGAPQGALNQIGQQFGVSPTGGGSGLSSASSLLSIGNFAKGLNSPLFSGGSLIGGAIDKLGASIGFNGVSAGTYGPVQGLSSQFTVGSGLASFGGNLLGDLIFGGDRGIGSTIGGTIGGIAGSFFGPLGSLAGSFLGNAMGGLFGGKKPSSKLQTGRVDLQTGNIIERTGLQGKKFSQENYDAVTSFSQLASGISAAFGGIKETLNIIVGNRNGLELQFGQGDQISYGQDVKAFTNALVKGVVERAPDVSDAVLTAITNIDFGEDLQKGLEDLDFAIAYGEGFTFLEDNATSLEKALEALADATYDAASTAQRLGLEEEKIYQARDQQLKTLRGDFNKGISDRLLELENPGAAGINNLTKSFVEVRRNAVAIGGDLVQVEKLFGLERQKILEESLSKQSTAYQDLADSVAETLRDIQKIRDDIRIDKQLSGTNRLGILNEAQGQLDRLTTRIRGGDQEAFKELDKTSKAYLEAALDYYGPTEQYLQRLEQVFSLLSEAEQSAKDSLTTEDKILLENQKQNELLQQLIDKSNKASKDIEKIGSVPMSSLLRQGGKPGNIDRLNTLNNLPEELVRRLKVTASDGRFDFSNPALAGVSFADFVKNGNRDAGERFLALLESFGGTGLEEQAKRFGFATGTGNRSFSGLAAVGEGGIELANFNQPTQIISNPHTNTLLGAQAMANEMQSYRKQSAKETEYLATQLAAVVRVVTDMKDDMARAVRAN